MKYIFWGPSIFHFYFFNVCNIVLNTKRNSYCKNQICKNQLHYQNNKLYTFTNMSFNVWGYNSCITGKESDYRDGEKY